MIDIHRNRNFDSFLACLHCGFRFLGRKDDLCPKCGSETKKKGDYIILK